MNFLIKIFILIVAACSAVPSQGVGVGERFNLTGKVNLGNGQFAQLFVPDYFVPPGDGKFLLVFHLHSASWAAEDELYKSNTNAIIFNIHLGSLSSPYQNYFSDKNKFNTILDTILSVINSNGIIANPQIKYLIITSFSAGYAGLREILKTESYYDMINSINLADGLHCSSDAGSAAIQMQDFLRFARDARDKKKIMLLTHSSITTSGYQSTTQTAGYLLNGLGLFVRSTNETDEIGTMYARSDTGYFHMRRYNGVTADDHLKHLYAMHLMLETVVSFLNSAPTDLFEDELIPGNIFLYQNYPNPFNPTTNFEFQIAEFGFVSLKVYDVLGIEITTIVNEYLPVGTHKYQWNANGLASGVYFYSLKSQNYFKTNKMILLQ